MLKSIQRAVRKGISKLPDSVKMPLLRQVVSCNYDLPDNMVFKVAETQSELEQAFKLLHDRYVAEGYMKPQASGMRITKYHLLPSTTTLVAKQNDLVVGTISLVRRGAFGLPMEEIQSIDELLTQHRNICEVSSLAIRKSHATEYGSLLFPLLKFSYEYAVKYFGADMYAIVVNPKWIDFYKAILTFTEWGERKSSYGFVEGAPAVTAVLDLHQAKRDFEKIYAGKKPERDLYEFFVKFSSKHFQFPERTYNKINDPILTASLIKHFFTNKSSVLNSLTDKEKQILRQIYKTPEYTRLIPPPVVTPLHVPRTAPRFDVKCPVSVYHEGELVGEGYVTNVSQHGLQISLNQPLPQEMALNTTIQISATESIKAQLKCQWQNERAVIGARIESVDPSWSDFVEYLQEDIFRQNKKIKLAS